MLSSQEQVELLADPNTWTRQTALRLIGDRKDKSLGPQLRELLEKATGQDALEFLWALNLVGGLDEATAQKSLEHPDPYVRLWTARLVCDGEKVSSSFAASLAHRAAIEPDVEVRSQLAWSARRLPARDALPIVRALLARSEDAGDIHIPLLLWWAIESKAGTDPRGGAGDVRGSLRLGPADREVDGAGATDASVRRGRHASGPDAMRRDFWPWRPSPDHVKRLMAGFESAYAGRSLAGLPPELAEALARYSRQSLTIGLRQGKPEAVTEALRLLADDRADRAKQLQLLQVLGEVRRPACVPVVLRIACESPDNALRSAALAALAGYDDPAIPAEVLEAYPNMSDDVLASAQSLLASRPGWAVPGSSTAIEARTIDPQTVPREVVEKLLLLGETGIADRVVQALRTDPACHVDRAARGGRPASRRRPSRVGSPQAGQGDLRPAMRPLPHPLRQGRQGRPRPHHVSSRRPRHHAPEHRQPQRRDPRGLFDRRSSPRPTDACSPAW